jgi:pullulanase-type alpha-1,6-glucosidase
MTSATRAARVNLDLARAHWLARDTIAWEPGPLPRGATFRLHHAADSRPRLVGREAAAGPSLALVEDPAGLPAPLRERFPHLAGLRAFHLPAVAGAELARLLLGALAVSAADRAARVLAATSVQIPGVLDDLYREEGPLGVIVGAGRPRLRVWAPTARSVRLQLFDGPRAPLAEVREMARDPRSGTWSSAGEPDWMGKYYLYEVEVFAPATGRVERNLVTDPWSLSLARNSARSQIVDLAHPAAKPPGWDALAKPPLEAPEDIVLYELHVRDFSASDPSVPPALRGTFKAFTLPSSQGLAHLQALADAGLTHVHLLPAFDFATVDEDRALWQEPAGELGSLPPDSEGQQAAVGAAAARDGFNWGYDPWHYSVPEGSYATDPDGVARILEFRELVMALNRRGLRVVLDVVYNHTHASGQDPRSVLDRVVPGYYHRLDADGRVLRSTCCENTASEHAMMEKLMLDSLRVWAREYKVDGFRFDLMGHHMKRNLLRVRESLDALTLAADGVDGRDVYLYGEGWDLGEMRDGARGPNATQRGLAGSGIGTFNDRLRDAARGGGPFGPLQEQGALTGLVDAPNGEDISEPRERRARLLRHMDRIRVGLAGGLADYAFEDHRGRTTRGAEVDQAGGPAGYTRDPQESVNYVESHDNETLFDAIQLKAPRWLPLSERVRLQNLGASLVALGQGVPFYHAGSELLRSKSLDRNSYDSGDWFNRLDFGYRSNNWGVGLPPARDNAANWAVHRPLLADPALRPGEPHIRRALAHFQELLRIRRSSRLFRLRTAEEVAEHLRFHDTGPHQHPGLLAWSLRDPSGRLDPAHAWIVVLWNAAGAPAALSLRELAGVPLVLHPVHAASDDPVLRAAVAERAGGTLRVPGRTAVVFWSARGAGE